MTYPPEPEPVPECKLCKSKNLIVEMAGFAVAITTITTGSSFINYAKAYQDPRHCDMQGYPSCYNIGNVHRMHDAQNGYGDGSLMIYPTLESTI